MKRLLTIALVGLILFGPTLAVAAPDTLCGPVSGTLTLAGSPYIVTCNVLVPDGNTLTIEPGVEIRFDDLYTLQVNGTLIAQGTAGNHIVFTSNSPTGAPGDWRQIFFSMSDGGTSLDYCDIFYAGGGLTNTTALNMFFSNPSISNITVRHTSSRAIYLSESSPTITNSTISNNTGMGIEAVDAGADPIIDNCTITNNGSYPISMFADNIKNIGAVTLTGNSNEGIRVEGEDVNTGVWLNHGVPYVMDGSVTVNDGHRLTINPGNELRFNGRYTFQVDGALTAQGTPGNHIVFTSHDSISPAPGDWNQLRFNMNDSTTIINYCDILYAGFVGAGIEMLSSSPTIFNSTVKYSATSGIALQTLSSPTITNSTFSDNAGIGINAANFTADPIITNCTISNNGDYAISMFADNIKNIGAVTITGNARNSIRVMGETVNTGVWLNHNVPYVIDGSVTVNDVNRLTIEPGNELRFNGLYAFQVNGTLVAEGTPGNRIVFTSNSAAPAPGDWRELFFNNDSLSSLEYCDILYGGAGALGTVSAINMFLSNGVSISNTSVRYSLSRGINSSDSYAIIRGCLIADNGGNGVHISGGGIALTPDLGTNASPGDNSFRDNGGWEVYNNTSDTIYAMHNYWVDTDSATIDTAHIYDDDENASRGVVIFTPWLVSDPTRVEEIPQVEIPSQFRLHQNYPNPFNPSTTIEFTVPSRESVDLKVFDVLGRQVATLVDEAKDPGTYGTAWDASDVSSGVYFYRLRTDTRSLTNKMVLMK